VLSALSPARRRLVLVVIGLVSTLAVVTAVTVVRQHAGSGVRPVAQDDPGPVLLVPGYGGSTERLAPLVTLLEGVGREVTVVEPGGDGTGDLRDQAQVLADAADAALTRTGAGSVDVVGYSAGGVVARVWVHELGGDGQARRVLTLGTPNHGTQVAGAASELVPAGCPTACEQLAPDSDLLRGLNAGDETPEGPTFVAVWTTLDELVTPPESARLAGALNITVQSVCPSSRVRHGELPEEPAVAAIVVATLGTAAPFVPEACPT